MHKKQTDQAHMIMAFRTYGAKDKRTPTTDLLAEVLGQGMSSRLFVKLRDEMGACYYVRARHEQNTDHGIFFIATGINVSRTEEVVKVLLEECRKLVQAPISDKELAKAKEHYIGHLYMNLETSDSLALFYATEEITTGKLKNPNEIERAIRKVSVKDVMKVAREIFKNGNLNLAIVGNVTDRRGVKKVLTFK